MLTALRLLILEDDPYDAELQVATLEKAGYVCQWERVETRAEFLARLAPPVPDYDLILADYNLPTFDGLTALKLCLERDLDLPFILVSGAVGEETAIESLKAGATDYVLKDRLARLGPVVRRALREKEEQRRRKRAEEEQARLLAQIQEQAHRVQRIMDTVPEGVLLLGTNGSAGWRVVLANPLGEKDLATLANAKVGDTLTHLGDRPLDELLTSPPKGLWHEIATDGRSFQVIARPIETGPTPEGWVLVIRDVTQQRKVEQRIQQQERLVAVGQLAAGIAHDFNNIMAVIVLYAQTALRAIPDLSSRNRERLMTVIQQAQRASNLIQQILDFSRRAVLERRPMDLMLFLEEQIKLLERTLPESIKIDLAYGVGEYTVNADPTRMQQMTMNLAVNARDAMPEGGELRIGLERMRIESHKGAPLLGMSPGEWVQVTVADTGMGIPSDVLPHVFEPFFTTKAPGQGSGLGLAQVYGIVKQHEGEIDVRSQVGRGTTFTIYLPALSVYQPEALPQETSAVPQGQGETILVVEDDATTRGALMDTLETLNYRVLGAANGREALTVLERRAGEIALLLSDVVMPDMGGVALFHAMGQRGLSVPVVMLTGHPVEAELEKLQAQGLRTWLPKPPGLEQLAQVVARVLREN